MSLVPPATFQFYAQEYIKNYHDYLADSTKNRIFSASFGISAMICTQILHLIDDIIQTNTSPKHLLWALLFLKHYNTVSHNASIVGVDDKTYRKWTWKILKAIKSIDFLVSLNKK